MFEGLLPIGSVVLVGDSTKRVMIVGVAQLGGEDGKTLWDYSGVLYPEGYIDSKKMFMFNNEQITQIYALGYQDGEQLKFKAKADEAIKKLREEGTEAGESDSEAK